MNIPKLQFFSDDDYEEAVRALENSSSHRILRRIDFPAKALALTDLPDHERCILRNGIFLDTETTGLDHDVDEVIQLCMMPFRFAVDRETKEAFLIKPVQKELETNLVITTDRRSYYLDLKSFEETYMTAMRWTYPQTEIRALTRLNERSRNSAVIDKGLQLEDLDFSYSIQGDDADWRPLRAFDDGRKIYIEFPVTIDRSEAPPLFVLGRKDEVELVNYRMRGNYYIVDRLFARAELRLGTDPQTRVQIVHQGGRRQ